MNRESVIKPEGVGRIDLHPLGGIAGDMFAAAMFDAWPDLYQAFMEDLEKLSIDGLTVVLKAEMSKGLSGKHFSVIQDVNEKPPRTLAAVKSFLGSKAIDTSVVEVAIDIYSLLAEAEAAVHGKTTDTIHFHEVSDWDSMVDIIAAAGVIRRLVCESWRIAALPLGSGTINTAHGAIPLPAPATVQLLQNYQWTDDGQPGERVTPTGAAIVAYLKPVPIDSGAMPVTLRAIGVGCGTRELADRANILRITAFDTVTEDRTENDVVSRLAFEVDDMTGEELAGAIDSIRQESAVIDVTSMSMQGKKGRHTIGVRLLALPDKKNHIISRCFMLFSTLGVRHAEVDRCTLKRSVKTVDGVRVKVASRPQGAVTAKAESDDVASQATLAQRRQVAARVEQIDTDNISDCGDKRTAPDKVQK